MGGCGRDEARGAKLGEESGEGKIAAAGGQDDEIHDDEHDFVAPSVGAGTSPEARAPEEDLFLSGAEHDENQADGGELGQDAEGKAEPGGEFRGTQKNREGLAHADALAARFGVFEMVEPAGEKDKSNHEAEEQKSEIGVRGELREGHGVAPKARQREQRVWLFLRANAMVGSENPRATS